MGFEFQFIEPFGEAALKEVGALAGFVGVQAGVGFAGEFLLPQSLRAVVPVVDLLGEAILHRSLGFGDEFQSALADLRKVLLHHGADSVGAGFVLQAGGNPRALRACQKSGGIRLAFLQGAVVEVGGVVQVAGVSGGIEFDIKHLFRDHPALTGAGEVGILNGVLQVEQDTGRGALVVFIDEDGTTAQEVAMALQHEVERGIQQRMTRADKSRHGLPLWLDEVLLESDALVAAEHRVPQADEAVAIPNGGRDVGNLVAPRLALPRRATKKAEGLHEEGLDVMGLEPPGIRPLHVLANAIDLAGVHGVMSERPLLDEVLESGAVKGTGNDVVETRTHVRLLAIANGLNHEFAQRLALEHDFSQNIENLAAEGFAGLFQLVEQGAIDLALAGLIGDEIPQVAYLRLADAVNAAEALLQAVRVPGKVVIHHEVRPLEVDAFAGGIGGDQHLYLRVMPEGFLHLQPLLTPHTAMNGDDGLTAAQQRADALGEVVQGVAMLGEEHEFLAR